MLLPADMLGSNRKIKSSKTLKLNLEKLVSRAEWIFKRANYLESKVWKHTCFYIYVCGHLHMERYYQWKNIYELKCLSTVWKNIRQPADLKQTCYTSLHIHLLRFYF